MTYNSVFIFQYTSHALIFPIYQHPLTETEEVLMFTLSLTFFKKISSIFHFREKTLNQYCLTEHSFYHNQLLNLTRAQSMFTVPRAL